MKNAKNVGQTCDEHQTNATVEPTEDVTSDYKKEKIALWLYPDTKAKIEELYKSDNCNSRSEFIEKAVKFYCGYLQQENSVDYLTPMIAETIRSELSLSSQQQAKMLFKLAVEQSLTAYLFASAKQFSMDYVKQVRRFCEDNVRRTSGIIDFETADKIIKSRRD
jgi:hypothetical protein